jgi:hypothetical protein
MGIDVYLNWRGKSEADKKAQFTGFSTQAGNVGYLREAYHGGPYATAVLISENWDDQPDDGFVIPAAGLRKRLPATVMTAIYRNHVVYGERLDDPSFVNFDDAGWTVVKDRLLAVFAEAANARKRGQDFKPNEEQTRAAEVLIASRKLAPSALAFVDFVLLAERKEAETGQPCTIIVSA